MVKGHSCLVEEPNAADAAKPLESAPVALQHPVPVARSTEALTSLGGSPFHPYRAPTFLGTY